MAEVSWTFEGHEYEPEYTVCKNERIYGLVHIAKVGGGTVGTRYNFGEKWAGLIEVQGEIVFAGGWKENRNNRTHEAVADAVWIAVTSEKNFAPIFKDYTQSRHTMIAAAYKNLMVCASCGALFKKESGLVGRCPGIRDVLHGEQAATHSCETFTTRGVCKHTLHCCVCDACVGKISKNDTERVKTQGVQGSAVTHGSRDAQKGNKVVTIRDLKVFNQEKLIANAAYGKATPFPSSASPILNGYYECAICGTTVLNPGPSEPGECEDALEVPATNFGAHDWRYSEQDLPF